MKIDREAGIYKVDIVTVSGQTNEKLRQNIERDGIEIYRDNSSPS